MIYKPPLWTSPWATRESGRMTSENAVWCFVTSAGEESGKKWVPMTAGLPLLYNDLPSEQEGLEFGHSTRGAVQEERGSAQTFADRLQAMGKINSDCRTIVMEVI